MLRNIWVGARGAISDAVRFGIFLEEARRIRDHVDVGRDGLRTR
jgi:hypothetical protein